MMNAHKFLAEHGIEEAKRVLSGAPDWAKFWISRDQYHGHIISFPNMTGHYSINLSELKQVVDSIEKITASGGIGLANLFDQSTYGENLDLDRAIADYKLVQAYKNGEVISE